MKFIDLLNWADPHIDHLRSCINPETNDFIEGQIPPLTAAIILELREMFDSEDSDENQLEKAIIAMLLIEDDIDDVINSLEEALQKIKVIT